MGLDPEVVDRVATFAAHGFESLPHCGAVVTLRSIKRRTQKEEYRDAGIIAFVILVIARLTVMSAATIRLG